MNFEQRMKYLAENIDCKDEVSPVQLAEYIKCEGEAHLQEMYSRVTSEGGAGLYLRQPNSLYEPALQPNFLVVEVQ
jgi:ATP-dependent DNA ligase